MDGLASHKTFAAGLQTPSRFGIGAHDKTVRTLHGSPHPIAMPSYRERRLRI